MTFRTRLLVIFLFAVLVPIGVLALVIRNEMTDRLTAQYERRVEALTAVIESDLAQESARLATSLEDIREAVMNDNRFRRAAVDGDEEERRYLLDYAGNAMRLTGLAMLQIQDDSGRIISSGHFRNEYDRLEPELPRLLRSTRDGTGLVRARAPDAPFLALARVDSTEQGSKRFWIVAGVKMERRFLARLVRGGELTVALVYPDGTLASDEDTITGASPHAVARELEVPFMDTEAGEVVPATFRVTHELTGLHELRGSIDLWFLVAVAITGLLAVLLVMWLASRISRPLVELADKTSRVDLDRLDINFETGRNDEIGILSRILAAMTQRLRTSTVLLKDAERRATLGELARQVNHDIKNGLTPIRNVFRHLADLARDDPEKLRDTFEDRQSTVDSSISYLENLASNYARLSPKSERRPYDVGDVVHRIVTDLAGADGVTLTMNLGTGTIVNGDPLSLRRIFENLVDNAIDSLETPGSVTISTELVSDKNDGERVRITVADTGGGMNEAQVAKIFNDFYTTKADGTGLGLSIVRRLVMDLDGHIRVESKKGGGTRFFVELPAVRPSHAGKES